jgi:hypothetical protein
VDLIMMIAGVIVPMSQTKPLYAVLHLHDYEPTSKEMTLLRDKL